MGSNNRFAVSPIAGVFVGSAQQKRRKPVVSTLSSIQGTSAPFFNPSTQNPRKVEIQGAHVKFESNRITNNVSPVPTISNGSPSPAESFVSTKVPSVKQFEELIIPLNITETEKLNSIDNNGKLEEPNVDKKVIDDNIPATINSLDGQIPRKPKNTLFTDNPFDNSLNSRFVFLRQQLQEVKQNTFPPSAFNTIQPTGFNTVQPSGFNTIQSNSFNLFQTNSF